MDTLDLIKARPFGLEEGRTKVVLDTRSGRTGPPAEWVEAFRACWARPDPDRFMDLLGPDVVLRAPGLRTTRGRAAGRAAFARTLAALPDLAATVHEWGARGETLFVAMTFRATIGGRAVEWDSVDRLRFRDGVAVERVATFNPVPVRRAYLGSLRGLRQLWRLRRLR